MSAQLPKWSAIGAEVGVAGTVAWSWYCGKMKPNPRNALTAKKVGALVAEWGEPPRRPRGDRARAQRQIDVVLAKASAHRRHAARLIELAERHEAWAAKLAASLAVAAEGGK